MLQIQIIKEATELIERFPGDKNVLIEQRKVINNAIRDLINAIDEDEYIKATGK